MRYGIVVRSFSGRTGKGSEGDLVCITEAQEPNVGAGFIRELEPIKRKKARNLKDLLRQ